jgi:hypothetical protein
MACKTGAGTCKTGATHSGHLCILVGEGKLDEVKKLVKKPKFICFNCGRVADAEKNLCNPMQLDGK